MSRFWKPRRLHADDMRVIIEGFELMAAELDRLTTSIQALTAEDDKAITIMSDLAAQIRDNIGDGPALSALADTVDAEVAKLQGAEPPAPAA